MKFQLRNMYEPFVVATLDVSEIASILHRPRRIIVLTIDCREFKCDSLRAVDENGNRIEQVC